MDGNRITAGVFALSCPQCDASLTLQADGRCHCTTCAVTYLFRFGHLVVLAKLTRPAFIGSRR